MNQRLVLMLLIGLLVACGPVAPGQTGRRPSGPVLAPGPTAPRGVAAAPAEPTPTNTLVLPEPWTPAPTSSPTPLPDEVLGLVSAVLEGDTIAVVLTGDRLNRTYTVRLLGIDAPVDSPSQPWGIVARERITQWLTGRVVRLERDQTDLDAEGALPRYVFLDNEFINLTMVEQGLARADVNAPDTRFAEQLAAAEDAARAARRGLWGPDPTATPTRTPTPLASEAAVTSTATLTATAALTVTPTAVVTETTPPPAATETIEATPTETQ